MELIIMQKLEYQLTRPTIQDFIKTVSTAHTLNIIHYIIFIATYIHNRYIYIFTISYYTNDILYFL